MRLFKKHELLPAGASEEQITEAIKNSGYIVLKQVSEFLGRDAKLFRDGQNINFILSQPLELVAEYYNLAVVIRQRTGDNAKNIASWIFGAVLRLIPLVNKYKGGSLTLEDIKDLVAKAEEDDEEDREAEA